MHETLAEKLVEIVRLRAQQGDCPTVEAPSVGNLESALIEIASQRDALKERTRHAEHNLANIIRTG